MSNELKVRWHPGGTAGNIILKSDGELVVLAVRVALAKCHGCIVLRDGPAVGESQWNGVVEEARKNGGGVCAVLQEQIEGKTNVKLRCDDVIIQRMTRWAAMMVSRNMVRKDGRNSYERRTDRACRASAVTFGENVWHKQIRKQKECKDKIESEWHEGLSLAQSRSFSETIRET